jgi:TonB family protein
MLHNHPHLRRCKQGLVLPILIGLVLLVAPPAKAQTTPGAGIKLSFPSTADRKTFNGTVVEAMRRDSLRTRGNFEPGTKQQVSVASTASQPNLITVTVTRVPVTPPAVLPVTSTGHKIYIYVEQMPQLPGGGSLLELVQLVQNKISYPKAAPGAVVPSGKVMVSFVVDTDGTVQNVKIVKGLSPRCDAAVLAAVQQLPRFEPGQQQGEPVAVALTIPVEFRAKPERAESK